MHGYATYSDQPLYPPTPRSPFESPPRSPSVQARLPTTLFASAGPYAATPSPALSSASDKSAAYSYFPPDTHYASYASPTAPPLLPSDPRQAATAGPRNVRSEALAFFAIIGIEAAVVLTMIALVYATIRLNTGGLSTSDVLASDPQLGTVATYVSLFILAVLFELGIALDACRAKNIMTLGVLCVFQFLMLVYSSVLPGQLNRALKGTNADSPHVHKLTHAYAIVIVAVVALASVCMSAMLWPLYREMGWSVFRKIGADLLLRRMYTRYQIFVCLLKFDAFFLVGFSIQFLILVSGTPTVEMVLTIIALPVSLVALGFFAVIVRIESRVGVYGSWFVQAAGIAYFIYKMSRIFSERSRYEAVHATLTIFAVICIIMLVATFIMMGLCLRNFDKGLRDRIPGYDFSNSASALPLRSHRTPLDADDEKSDRPGLPRRGTTGAGSKANRTETRMSID
ncbi:hypothetical protein JCM8202v2_001376 [Rhodotorula sphaerocarpa]